MGKSIWSEHADIPEREALEGGIEAEVVVIGSRFDYKGRLLDNSAHRNLQNFNGFGIDR